MAFLTSSEDEEKTLKGTKEVREVQRTSYYAYEQISSPVAGLKTGIL